MTGVAAKPRRRGPSDELLCGCANLSRDAFIAEVARRPTASFDTLLDVTGSGRECTACMLDLEYLFTESPRDGAAAKRLARDETSTPTALSPKQRLYALLDRVPVMMPWNLTNWMPVLHGGVITEYLWMANHQLLYDGPGANSDVDIRYRLRDGAGNTVYKERRTLAKDENFRIDLSSKFPPADTLSIGSIAIDRYPDRPTVCGTTRPQIEINCPKSAASLHFQAAAPNQTSSHRIPWQPDIQRALFTIVNAGRQPYRVNFSYWINESRQLAPIGEAERLVPPFGSILHEVDLSAEAVRALGSKFLQVRWQTVGHGKLHFICLSRDGERLSIDHL